MNLSFILPHLGMGQNLRSCQKHRCWSCFGAKNHFNPPWLDWLGYSTVPKRDEYMYTVYIYNHIYTYKYHIYIYIYSRNAHDIKAL